MFPSTRLAQQNALQELNTSSADYSHVNPGMVKEVHDSLTAVPFRIFFIRYFVSAKPNFRGRYVRNSHAFELLHR